MTEKKTLAERFPQLSQLSVNRDWYARDEVQALFKALNDAEYERDANKAANIEWQEKTEWVQKQAAFPFPQWGMHRADVMTKYIEHLQAELVEMTNQYVDRTAALSFASQRAEKAEAVRPICVRQAIDNMENHDYCDSINVAYKYGWNDAIKAAGITVKSADGELAAIRGAAVPIYQYCKGTSPRYSSWADINIHEYLDRTNAGEDTRILFTHPAPPVVVLPKRVKVARFVGHSLKATYRDEHRPEEIIQAMRDAGIIVKSAEGEVGE